MVECLCEIMLRVEQAECECGDRVMHEKVFRKEKEARRAARARESSGLFGLDQSIQVS